MHLSFIHILFPQFIIDGLVNVVIFKVGYICVHLGMLNALVRDDCCNIWSREGFRCIVCDGWLIDMAVGCPKIMLHILHLPGKLFQVSWTRIGDITF